jgi:hypothetical protein
VNRPPQSVFGDQYQPDIETERPPAPGWQAFLLAALLIGFLLMGIQLWLLTVALDLYLGGEGEKVWLLALISGAVFLGGALALRLLGRHPHWEGRRRRP